MPTLDWIGKQAVVNHHREVPTRLLHCNGALSAGDPDAGNLLVEGDNLEALKALLPYYAGQVKCVYIDPPYNTGNEEWIYNDNVNSPEIREWLGRVVGHEAEDLTRHDKWLCMMYPRLRILRDFLREDGFIVSSIADEEVHNLKWLMSEIFGADNFTTQIVVQSNVRGQTYKSVAKTHEYALIFARSSAGELSEISDVDRAFDFHDDRGGYELWELRNRNPRFDRSNRPNLYFPIYADAVVFENDHHSVTLDRVSDDQIEVLPTNSEGADGCWRWSRDLIIRKRLGTECPDLVARQNRNGKWTVWQRARKSTKRVKTVLQGSEYLNENGTSLLTAMGLRGKFDFPKPIGLIRTVLELCTEEDDIILDSFAGSGTTGHSVLEINRDEESQRRFILVEMDKATASGVTAERLSRAISGYRRNGKSGVDVAGLGGGFRYCTLGKPLFDEWGGITEGVTFPDLAAFVFFSDTGSPIPAKARSDTPLLGTFQGRAVYLLWAADSAGVASEPAGNVLTPERLASLPLPSPGFDGGRTIYGEGCTVAPERLAAVGVTFKQIPYQVAAG